jgi:hypothetical protein
MDIKNIKCPVEAPEAFGEYANAFRIVPAGGNDLFLDFCLYSQQSNKAKVVARVRCTPEFVDVMMQRIQSTSPEPSSPDRLYFVLPGNMEDN